MNHVLWPFFQGLADAFVAGDFARIVNACSYPLAIYVSGELLIENSPDESMAAIKSRRDMVLRHDIASILTKILEVGEAGEDRFPVRIDWVFLDADGKAIGSNQLRYFCQTTARGDTKIHLVEFLEAWFGMSPSTTPPKLH